MTSGAILELTECSDTTLRELRERAERLNGSAEPQETLPFTTGYMVHCDLRALVKDALRHDIRDCPLSRDQIADGIAKLAGRACKRPQIDAWAAETNANNLPAHLVPFWVLTTGSRRLFDLLLASAGLYLADQREHDLAELAQMGIEAGRIRRQRRDIERRLKG